MPALRFVLLTLTADQSDSVFTGLCWKSFQRRLRHGCIIRDTQTAEDYVAKVFIPALLPSMMSTRAFCRWRRTSSVRQPCVQKKNSCWYQPPSCRSQRYTITRFASRRPFAWRWSSYYSDVPESQPTTTLARSKHQN